MRKLFCILGILVVIGVSSCSEGAYATAQSTPTVKHEKTLTVLM